MTRFNSISPHFHYWRGFRWERGLLVAYVTIGFVTFAAEDIDAILTLNKLKDQLDKLARRK